MAKKNTNTEMKQVLAIELKAAQGEFEQAKSAVAGAQSDKKGAAIKRMRAAGEEVARLKREKASL